MKVLKFGGTSVGSAERMKSLVALIKSSEPKIVVLSAMSGTTNSLVEIASALYARENDKAKKFIDALEKKYEGVIKELYSKESSLNKGKDLVKTHFEYIRAFTLDMFTANEEKAILAQGELLSTALEHFYLEEIGIESVLLPALNFMRIDENDEPDMKYIEDNLKSELKKYSGKKLFITQGYICRNAFGEIDNLKRGGSDYTATLIGAALTSEEIQIWTDINGMHNNDPRIVAKTFPVTELSFDEAAELAYFGAKILHPTCVLPAQKRKVPVRLLNTMQPEAKGTVITEKAPSDRITAVAAKDGIIAVKIRSARMLLAYGFLRSVFEIFERYKTPIDMITTSEVAVSVTIDNDRNLDSILRELKEFCSVEVDKDQTIVCVVGNFSAEKQGIAAKILEALKNIPLRMISYGGSENNVSVLVDSKYKKDALVALNKGLFNYDLIPNPSPTGRRERKYPMTEKRPFHIDAAPIVFEYANTLKKEMTEAEKRMWEKLRNRRLDDLKFRRQHPVGKFILDFYCHALMLAVEIDGNIHEQEDVKEKDEGRTYMLTEWEITVVRFTNEEVMNRMGFVLGKIKSFNKI